MGKNIARGALAVVAVCLAVLPLRAESLPEYPAAARDQLATLITPIKQVLSTDGIPLRPNDTGCVLLDEGFVTVDGQGLRTIVRQKAYKTLTDGGVQDNSEEVVTYRKKEQVIYLITAETIQADGTHQPVKPDAVLIQSPQRQAEYSLYDDQAEMKVIFPNIKPGSVTHLVYVIQDQVAKMPGEFSASYTWGREWAAGLIRYQIDLPEAMAARLKLETLGNGVPALTTDKRAGGRVVYAWTLTNVPGRRYEIESPPDRQVGPVINLTTVQSWDDIGRWYRGLLAGHGKVNEALARQADAWTAGAKDQAAVIAALHSKVADDVRYVGLEFGAADYQPHSCNDVWDNQYGDCKDKANLLAALLRHKGIEACITLVNTDHTGLVDRRTPDFRVFNHAIVAVPQKNGGFLFCDPTIEYSVPGMLSPGSADRDVLVITDQEARWVHTPAQSAGDLTYEFELKLADSGELSGWLAYRAEGYYGAGERGRFTKLDVDDARSEMSKVVRGFYSGAEIVDVARTDQPSPAPYVIKAYFIVPGGERTAGAGSYPLKFPSSSALFADFGDRVERKTSFFMYRDRVRAKVSISLPAGLRPASVPPPFSFDSPAVASHASWDFAAGLCRTDLWVESKQSVLKADDFRAVYQSNQSLQSWLAQPVMLNASGAKPEIAAAAPAIDLPMMPSGDGQVELVDKRYPEEGNQEARRLALERALQYYPNDKETVFRLGGRLAVIDWNAERNEAAHERLKALLARYDGQIKAEVFAWGELVEGLVLRDLHRMPEALALLERVARNKNISDSRRSEAAVNLADLTMKDSPAKALALLREIAALPEGATPAVQSRIARLLIGPEGNGELQKHLVAIVNSQPDTAEAQLTAILEAALRWKAEGDDRRIELLAATVDMIIPKPGEALLKASQACHLEAAERRVHQQLIAQLATKPLSDWFTREAAGKSLGLADSKKAVDEASKQEDPGRCLRLSLQALASHGTEEGFPERLWNAAAYAEWAERKTGVVIDPGVCALLLDLCEQLPVGQAYYFEGRLLRAKRLLRDGNRAGEQAILREVLASPQITEQFIAPTAKKLGVSLEAIGDYPGALAAYKQAEPVAASYRAGADCLLHAVLINLQLGQDDEALRVIRLLEKFPDDTLKVAAAEAQIRELVALARSGHAVEYWTAGRLWWPEWERFAGAVDFVPEARSAMVPEIPSLTNLGETLGAAKKNGDKPDYFRNLGLLVSAARWQPSLAYELGSLGGITTQVVPDHVADLRRLLLAVLAVPHPAGLPGLRERQLFLAANYYDDHQAAKGLQVVHDFNGLNPPDDRITQAMHRVYALLVLELGQEIDLAIAALEKDLADPKAGAQRAQTVGFLADLYHRQGREPDEESLLTREIANPVIVADTGGCASLESRRGRVTGNRRFGAGLDALMKSLDLHWYDYTNPRSLADPRLKDLETVLGQPDRYFQRAEKAKLLLLAAADVRRPLDRRQPVLREAIHDLLFAAPDFHRINAILAAVIDNAELDEETRVEALWAGLVILSGENRAADYRQWRNHALAGRFNESMKPKLALLDLFVALDRDSPDAILKLADSLAAQEMSAFGMLLMSDLLNALLRHGDLAGAEKMLAAVPAWRLAADAGAGTETVQLEYARRIRRIKAVNPVHEALAAAVAARFAEQPARLPAVYDDLRLNTELPLLDRAATLEGALYLMRNRQYAREDFQFWGTLLYSLPRNSDTNAIITGFMHAALPAAPDDQVRAELISTFLGKIDLDDADLRHRVYAELAAYRRPVEEPQSYRVIRLYEIRYLMRLGDATDPELAFADLNDSRIKPLQLSLALDIYTNRGDRPALQRVIAGTDSGTLLSPNILTHAIPAFALLGMEDELRLAKEVAGRELHQQLSSSWAFRDPVATYRALHLAEVIGQPGLLPAGWVAEISQGIGDPVLQHHALLTAAQLASDWAGVEAQAAILNRDFPTHYFYFWHRGLALQRLGREPEAAKALETYTTYAKDESNYPAAVELLKQIRAALPAKP